MTDNARKMTGGYPGERSRCGYSRTSSCSSAWDSTFACLGKIDYESIIEFLCSDLHEQSEDPERVDEIQYQVRGQVIYPFYAGHGVPVVRHGLILMHVRV